LLAWNSNNIISDDPRVTLTHMVNFGIGFLSQEWMNLGTSNTHTYIHYCKYRYQVTGDKLPQRGHGEVQVSYF